MPQFIRFSLFPLTVKITNPEGEEVFNHYKSRVVVTDDEVYVYVDGNSGKVENPYTYALEDFSGDAKIGWTALTDEGDTVYLTRSASCSCGSRLKGFNPFPGVSVEPRS